MAEKVNRNDPCPCGSGKKYKKCCWSKDREPRKLSATLLKGGGNPLSGLINKSFSDQKVSSKRKITIYNKDGQIMTKPAEQEEDAQETKPEETTANTSEQVPEQNED